MWNGEYFFIYFILINSDLGELNIFGFDMVLFSLAILKEFLSFILLNLKEVIKLKGQVMGPFRWLIDDVGCNFPVCLTTLVSYFVAVFLQYLCLLGAFCLYEGV